jgi:hypothetical protein
MNTHDQTPAAPTFPSPEKRAYHTPRVTDLGDVRELTRGGGGSVFDGRGQPTKG